MRGEGSILDAIKQPELAAAITLQPVRRYGVDAAVLYSDIVVPPHAAGFGIDVAPGTGPVAPDPLRRRADLDRLRPLEADRHPVRRRDRRAGRRRARPGRAGAGVRRGAVHRRQLPDRGRAEPHVRAHQGPAAHRRGAVARRHGATRRDGRRVHRRPARRAVPRRSSCSTRGPARSHAPTTSATCCRTRAASSPSSPTSTPTPRASTSASGATTSSRPCTPPDRASWASTGARRSPAARARLGADLVVQGNLDPALVLAGSGPALAGARAVLADNDGHPGHVFNLGHGVHPTTDPGVLAADRGPRARGDAVTTGVVLMAYGTPRTPDGDRALLHRHPARPAADARAARRPDPALRRDRRDLPARRADGAAARRAAGRPRRAGARRLRRRARPQARRPEGRGRRRRARRGRRRAHRRPRARTALLGAVDRRVPRPSRRRRRRRRAAVRRHRELGHRAGVRRVPRRAPCAAGLADLPTGSRAVFTAHSLPARILAAGDPYPAELARDGRGGGGPPAARRVVARRGSRRAARPSRGSGPTSSPSSTSSPAAPPGSSCARAASSPTTSRCSTTSTSRPASEPPRPGCRSPGRRR